MPIMVNGRAYRFCLVDTNFLSGIIQGESGPPRRLLDRLSATTTIPAVTLYSVIEIRRKPKLWPLLLNWLADFPSALLKTTHQLLNDEIEAYPDSSSVNPVLLVPYAIDPPGGMSRLEFLTKAFDENGLRKELDNLSSGREEILDHLLGLVENYPPAGERYTDAEVLDFVEKLCFQQVAFQNLQWIERRGGAKADFDHHAFPSVKAAAYSVFFKLYWDADRNPRPSDPFDLGIAAAVPYMDMVALEADQAHMIRQKISRLDPFLRDVEVLTMKDLR